jgi:anhydro-N-acetylmuramic acid kinase
MKYTEYNVVGVMSGTSLDGIDLIFVKFKFEGSWLFEIIHAETVAYEFGWGDKLKNLVSYSPEFLKQIDDDYTKYLAKVIKSFIVKYDLKNLDAVCSHGHTALHRPENGLTYQIGNLPEISRLINQKVVCDFRVQDVKLGGQGAPLVPIGDKLLFSEYDFCLNLGGFANISTEFNKERIAYDICPVNIVLNHYVKSLGVDFDDKGKLALAGKINETLLSKLNDLEFYKKTYPKSLGLEWVGKHIFSLIDSFQLDIKDILKSFVEHIAIQLSNEINRKSNASVLVTGGGVYNDYLIKRLEYYSINKIVIPSKDIIEFKEALIFGFLGVLKMRNEVNCLQSVTGASQNHSSGMVYIP